MSQRLIETLSKHLKLELLRENHMWKGLGAMLLFLALRKMLEAKNEEKDMAKRGKRKQKYSGKNKKNKDTQENKDDKDQEDNQLSFDSVNLLPLVEIPKWPGEDKPNA